MKRGVGSSKSKSASELVQLEKPFLLVYKCCSWTHLPPRVLRSATSKDGRERESEVGESQEPGAVMTLSESCRWRRDDRRTGGDVITGSREDPPHHKPRQVTVEHGHKALLPPRGEADRDESMIPT